MKTLFLNSLAACFLLLSVGCEPTKEPATSESVKPSKPMVPLRVWMVANNEQTDQAFVQRQWQAGSEQPLDFRIVTKEALLTSAKCESDVVIYPAHLLGEFIHRGWVSELPSSLQNRREHRTVSGNASGPVSVSGTQSSLEDNLAMEQAKPAAWIDQSRYAGRLWGLSLGATAPIVMANFPLPVALTQSETSGQDPVAFWNQLIEMLPAGTEKHSSATDDIDYESLCQRYLVIAVSINHREPRFGLLIDPETLKCRLGEAEFVEAARILNRIGERNYSAQALLGNPSSAWQSLANEKPNVTIGLPPRPSTDVDRVTSVSGSAPPANVTITNAASKGARSTAGWNSGNGLIVSLANECRQTSQAVEFSKWITSESNRDMLGKRFEGIATGSNYPPSSSAWQIQRIAARLTQQPRLPMEPRIVASTQYREALGKQLANMLSGTCEAEKAMLQAAVEWDQITAKQPSRRELRTHVEQSLGL